MIGSYLYELGGLPVSIALYPFFALNERGAKRLTDRYGQWYLPAGEYLWFHGASMGEVNGLLPIADALKGQIKVTTLLTATSVTGLDRGAGSFAELRLLPFDNRVWLQRALNQVRLKGLIIGETEIWPSLFKFLGERNVAICFANARMSEETFRRYRIFKSALGPLFEKLRIILTVDEKAAERFVTLGALPERVKVVGNAKYDKVAAAVQVSQCFASLKPVLVLGSLWPEELNIWLEALARYQSSLNIILAPRHLEKLSVFEETLSGRKLPNIRWSKREGRLVDNQIILVDTMGELEGLYSLADLAFIGGSLVDAGGHNPLEAAQFRKFIAVGPQHQVVTELIDDLRTCQSVEVLKSSDDCSNILARLSTDPQFFRMRGQRSFEVVTKHRGATNRIVAALHEHVPELFG